MEGAESKYKSCYESRILVACCLLCQSIGTNSCYQKAQEKHRVVGKRQANKLEWNRYKACKWLQCHVCKIYPIRPAQEHSVIYVQMVGYRIFDPPVIPHVLIYIVGRADHCAVWIPDDGQKKRQSYRKVYSTRYCIFVKRSPVHSDTITYCHANLYKNQPKIYA